MVHDVEFRSALKGGSLHVPKGREKSPGLLLLHGSEGGFAGWMARDALALAMNGFVTFAYSYSKGGNYWHAGDIHDVDLDETVDALRWLREHPTVSGKVGLYGHSRGAEHAILLASLMARDGLADPPDAVAAHAASDTIAGAFIAGAKTVSGLDAPFPLKAGRGDEARNAAADRIAVKASLFSRSRGISMCLICISIN